MAANTLDIRRAQERFETRTFWLDSKHSFSFGPHYDPGNTHFGLLVVSNDDIVRPGTGFQTHPHRDMEIVTWVLDGELEHKDSTGNRGIIVPGLAQRMTAGRGIFHSEMNPSGDKPVHFIQMWVLPDTERLDPGYEEKQIATDLDRGGLFPIASGTGHAGAIRIRQKQATLWGARMKPGDSVTLPDAPSAHLYIAKGSVRLEDGGQLDPGDSIRMTQAGARNLKALSDHAEILLWEFNK